MAIPASHLRLVGDERIERQDVLDVLGARLQQDVTSVFAVGARRGVWHGSLFALDDGRVLEGPSTYPQACFDVRNSR